MKGNIFTDYYLGELLTSAKSRYEIKKSHGEHPFLESLLINHKKFNVGGLSFNYNPRPSKFKGNANRLCEMIIGKGSSNISSVFVPNIFKNYIAYGDVNTTNDALIIIIDHNKNTIELFIARGLKNDKQQLHSEVCDGYYDDEMNKLRQMATNRLKE